MSETFIGKIPPGSMYREGAEIDCQCARCGSSVDYEPCSICDDGVLWDDDPESDDAYVCDTCNGDGGWHRCMSSPEWCEDNPLEGRENVKRGEIEWFTIPERTP